VTLRNLMTMTSGYEDFAPQDYIIPVWLTPIDSTQLVFRWASKPLDFEPGTQWQYSNTNYVLMALIVQKVSGEPFAKFVREHVIDPAGLKGVFNTYTERQRLQVTGYVSNAMAPVRVQPLEANGWYFGDGDLAMPASTLAAWDITIMNRSLLSAVSYKEFETPFVLKDGTSTNYALGNAVTVRNGHRVLEHGGEVGGYVSENIILPDDYAAVVVLTNEVASPAASMIAHKIQDLIVPAAGVVAGAATDPFVVELKDILTGLQTKKIDRSLFTDDCNSYFNKDTLDDFASTLGPMGTITSVALARSALRGGMKMGSWRVTFSNGTTVLVSTYMVANGKIEQLLVEGKV
jgi:D-alanyl-D-alanine carboxypeptidase